jgi:hypothetical protein
LTAYSLDFFSSYRIEGSYYYEDEGLLNDPDYINARDNLYPQFIIDLRRDGGALRIKNTDIAVYFNPTDPTQTYEDLLCTILIKLDREFREDTRLWEFTKRDLRWKLNRIYEQERKKEEDLTEKEKKQKQDYDHYDDEEEEHDEEKKRTAKARKALELAIANSKELFVNEFGRTFAAMKVSDHVEVHPMDEQRFKNWISGIYYERNDDLLSEEDLKKIVRILTAKAEFPSSGVSRHRLDVRVRGYNKKQEEQFQNDDSKFGRK